MGKEKTNSLKNPLTRFFSNIGFKKIEYPPQWVIQASNKYYKSFSRKYGHLPYNVKKHFVGKRFVYRVFYKTVAQGQIENKYWVKKK